MFSTLTNELKTSGSPFRAYLVEQFPNASALVADFKAGSGPLLVDGGDATPSTVGTAFDVLIRLLIDIAQDPTEFPRTRWWTETHDTASAALVAIVKQGLAAGGDDDDIYRACWGIALLTETYRSSYSLIHSPVSPIMFEQGGSIPLILELAPIDGIRQLRELRELAAERLLQQLSGPFHLAPDFYCSGYLKADADLIAGGTLLDLKVALGTWNKAKTGRFDTITPQYVYQVLAYLLFDTNNEYEITDIGFYSARYGNLHTWPVQDALDQLAGEHTNIEVARADMLMHFQLG